MRRPKVISEERVVILNLVTLGIYTLFWYYRANRELRDLGRERGDELGQTRPVLSALAITVGGLLIVPPYVSFIRFARRLQRSERLVTGRTDGVTGVVALLLAGLVAAFVGGLLDVGPAVLLTGIVAILALNTTAIAIVQGRLNELWIVDERRVPAVGAQPLPAGR